MSFLHAFTVGPGCRLCGGLPWMHDREAFATVLRSYGRLLAIPNRQRSTLVTDHEALQAEATAIAYDMAVAESYTR